MMTAEQFKSSSSVFMHRRSSPILKDIDKLLVASEAAGASPNRRIKCLVYVYMVCLQFLKTRPESRRACAVRDLKDEVKQVLNSKATAEQLTRKGAGESYSAGRKVDKMDSLGKEMKMLDAPYLYEGVLPQRNFVEKMGLHMEEIIGHTQYHSASDVVRQVLERFKGREGLRDHHAAAKRATTMPLSEILDTLHSMWASKGENGFEYLNGSQRLEHLIVFKGGRLVNYATGQPLTRPSFLFKHMYAMDLNERLFVKTLYDPGVTFNHSSFLSGAPVICAGMLYCVNGQLTEIDNESGHYKPARENLVDLVRVLATNGIDVDSFKVACKWGGGAQGSTPARAFLQSARGGGSVRLG